MNEYPTGNLIRYTTVRNSPSSVLLLRGRKRTHSDSSASMGENDEIEDEVRRSPPARITYSDQPSIDSGLRTSRSSYKSNDLPLDSLLSSPNGLSRGQSKINGNSNDAAPLIQPLIRHMSSSGSGNGGNGGGGGGGIRNFLKAAAPSNRYFDIQKLYSAAPFLSNNSSEGSKQKLASQDYNFKSQDQKLYAGVVAVSERKEDFFPDDAKEGLLNVRATTLLLLWYFFSFCTLFLNKYILSFLQGEPTLLGAVQMVSTTCLGFVQMYIPCGLYRRVERKGQPSGFWRNMALVGSMRFSTVVLGLFALKYISVSFTETVKSTAPLFTVIIAWLVLRDRCGLYVLCSLLPVMGGLALCSAYELSFHLIGFSAAVGTNLMDCLQNVFSKLLISGDDYKYTPAELQFYTSVASIVVQIPASFFVMDFYHAQQDLNSGRMFAALLTNGLCFHLQSITAYALMSYISPITHSVANTAKRAILIWLSVLVFGNDVTLMSAAGTAMVLVGVLLYNKARDYELQRQKLKEHLAAITGEGPYHHRIV